ncbi:thyroid adenoma-associated protein homolog [Bradysia coprophila]|uniref:thyroid adenoma-associated protein homolog n=1 Tax=Bradysia coprophila TaxID=38358 RepID=UPI00187DDA4C|nr:thyroid adenoma-associated protein homolog [Bradysia coprophila]
MNGLSLRVSTIKMSENVKKNSEIQISVIKVTDKCLNRFASQFAEESEAYSWLSEFIDATSIEQQLSSVKKLFNVLESRSSSTELCKHIVEFLSDWYFIAPLRHPVRNLIARNFDKMATHQTVIIKCLAETAIKNCTKIDNSSSVNELNTTVISLEGFADNFHIGILALHQCFDAVFPLLVTSITQYLMEIEKPNSPANLSEIFIFLHGSVRLSLWYVQRCVADRSLKKTDQLADLAKFCKIIINCAAVPMDTKLNCGIFLVLNEIIRDNLQELSSHLAAIRVTQSTETNVDTLCWCYGLCNTLPSSDLFHERGSLLIEVIEILRTIADKYSNEQTMLLGACRALVQMTKSFLTLNMVSASENATKSASMTELVPHCLSFVWSYFEHHLDTVRHFCKDIYRNLLKLSQRHDRDYTFILSTVLATVKNQEISRNAQYVATEHLCQEMQVESILDSWPTIFDDLFNNLDDPKCLSCYQKMMSIHCKEIDVQSWFQIWIRPLLCDSADSVDLQTKECLVNVAIKTHPMVPSYFLQEKDKLPLELYLFVVSTIRRNGLVLGKHFVPADDEFICGAKFHSNDDIRIMHLRIFVEVQKTTRPFTADDLNEILEFLYYNSNCQSPAFRQKINAFMTKAFNRIEASYPSVLKDPLKTTHTAYIEFLDKMKQLCLSNIFDGANFSRRAISLSLLLQTVTVSGKNNKISPEALWTTESFEKLVQSLSDTYEANKAFAVDIIRLCPKELVPTSDRFDLQYLKDLTTSVKPMDCLTAAYSLEYCCITGINFSSYLEAISWCNEILVDGLKTAQSSLLIAARTNPLFGLIFCIRHLMNRVDLKKTYEPRWRDFVKQLIELCKKLTEVVGPIVNSSSPEGHLPNDHSNVSNFLPNEIDSANGPPNKILSPRSQHDNTECLSTTPQMLLLCSWRTVKEVSLLLGDLTLNAPILTESSPGVVTVEEILEIGNHFHVLLSETKHRGAFEQAFVGFSKLCVRLWRAKESRLHQLPMIWLKDLLNIISGNDSSSATDLKFDKICSTRRSAGVPFMIQAILTSELQVCTTNGLKYSMVTLLEICRNGSAAEARTHALNILRALFRCTDLGDSIGEYISDGIECAIRGYSSDNWPERNSSTLLFSSLIIRVFGVQRTKDSENLNIRNKMTGRIFFLKYPRLFDFFILELQSATRSIEKDQVPPTLHPLLILLSRLYPSAVDGCSSNLKLSLLLPFIAQCTHSPELGTRKLAVKSIVALVPQYELYNYVNGVVKQLLENGTTANMNSNAIHGSLLQIYHLIKSVDTKLFAKHFDDFVSLTKAYLNLNVLDSNNFVLVRVYVDSIIEILRRIGSSKVSETDLSASLVKVTGFLSTVLSEHQNNSIGFPLALKSCLVLHSMINIHQIHQLSFVQNLFQRPYEYVEAALNIILLVLNHTGPDNIFDRFECDRNERQFLDYLTIGQQESLRHSIIGAEQLISELNRIIDDETTFYPFCTVKAYTVLGDLNLHTVSEDDLLDLIEIRTVDQIDDVKASIVQYAGNHLSKFFGTMSEASVMRLLTKLREMASPDGSDELRSSVSLVVSKMYRTWSSTTSVLLFADIVLILLRDECSDIRDTMSQFVQYSSYKPAVLPSLAEEQFIDWLDQQLELLNTEKPWTVWRQLITKQFDRKSSENEDTIDEVFERSESNVFGEVVLVCRKLMGKFHKSLTESGLSAEDVDENIRSIESDWPELSNCESYYMNLNK